MKKMGYIIIYLVLSLLIFCSACYLFYYFYSTHHSKKEASLLNQLPSTSNFTSDKEIDDKPIVIEKTERMSKLETLQKQNSDIIGWIEIKGTKINYPVVQGKNNSYYLNHNYKKKYSANGAVFLDKDYTWDPPSSNLLIYGHHTTFKDLFNYQNKKFYNEHPSIRFTTTKEDTDYEIIAVFKSKVYYQSEKNVFRYYYFIDAKNEEEYNEFIANSQKASLYDTGKTASYGEQLITLSTCSYHTKDGRFVVVGKKITNN